jgi:hypothetical protein
LISRAHNRIVPQLGSPPACRADRAEPCARIARLRQSTGSDNCAATDGHEKRRSCGSGRAAFTILMRPAWQAGRRRDATEGRRMDSPLSPMSG